LTEFFTFPQKFLFFDLGGLDPEVLGKAGNKLEIYFYLDRSTVDLERNVGKEMFQFGCTPVVNLFRQRAEPIALTHAEAEYRVVPDARRPLAGEVYSIDRVTATSPDNRQVEYQPFYSFKHASDRCERKAFWYATRRPAAGELDRGTEVFLSLVDLAFSPSSPADGTLDVETTCLNRDLPHRLPLGEDQPNMRLAKGGPLRRIVCVTGRPTPTLRPAMKHGAMWRLISHLSLNHLSLVDYEEGADALREILKLYDFADSAETRAMIDGIRSVRSRRVTGRSPTDAGGFCRGVEVTVHFDEEAVRLLQRLAAERLHEDAAPHRHAVGEDHAPKQEAVRFRALPSHGFPPGSISEIRPSSDRGADENGKGPELVTAFMGLVGPAGVLPRHYTTLLIERIREKDFALRDFLDPFHHRIVSLFYRAWEKYRFRRSRSSCSSTRPTR